MTHFHSTAHYGDAAQPGQDVLTPLAVNLLDPTSLLSAAGPLAVLLVLFCETGLLVGFFLPGDSLLFIAGVLSAADSRAVHLSLPLTLLCASVGALSGAQLGYLIGERAGRPLLARSRSPRLNLDPPLQFVIMEDVA